MVERLDSERCDSSVENTIDRSALNELIATVKNTVFYTQERVGKGWRLFSVLKLRTMVHGADKNVPVEVLEWRKNAIQDSRIIWWMGPIRSLWIDELPQLKSVWKWDMSIFWVRPMPENEYITYSQKQQERYKKYKPWFFGESWFVTIVNKRFQARKNRSEAELWVQKYIPTEPNFRKLKDTYLRLRYIKEKEWEQSLQWFHFWIFLRSILYIASLKHK